MKIIVNVILVLLISFQCLAQEGKKVYLNFFTGVAAFKTHVTHVEGTDFKSSNLYSRAPTGLESIWN